MFPVNRFRQQIATPDGHLIDPTGLRIPVWGLSITRDGEWWGGQVLSYPGDTIKPGIFHLTMDDGRTVDLSIDEIHVGPFDVTRAAFHGIGRAP
jgi:hypothetical protein